jgi:hypothetical protein
MLCWRGRVCGQKSVDPKLLFDLVPFLLMEGARVYFVACFKIPFDPVWVWALDGGKRIFDTRAMQ